MSFSPRKPNDDSSPRGLRKKLKEERERSIRSQILVDRLFDYIRMNGDSLLTNHESHDEYHELIVDREHLGMSYTQEEFQNVAKREMPEAAS